MKLSDKSSYPYAIEYTGKQLEYQLGLTFRERLIVALASNPVSLQNSDGVPHVSATMTKDIASSIVNQADAIIKELEAE